MAREVLAVNETSLFTQSSEDQADENSGCDDDDVESCDFLSNETQKSTSFLMQLTVGIGGLQVAYSTFFSHGLLHLRFLGLSDAQNAIILIAGPLCGAFVQPCFGIWSDHCQFSWGRRRPFIAFGTAIVLVSLLGLAWTKSLATMFSDISDARIAADRLTLVIATMSTFFFWFGTQPIQCGIRSLIFDMCPTNQQESANAWANRYISIANIIAYFMASIDLQGRLAIFGDSQFKTMSVLASLCLAITITITCISITEDDNNMVRVRSEKNKIFEKICETYQEIKATPKQVIIVFVVQFFAWFGWFPYLFYVTTYISELYVAEFSGKTTEFHMPQRHNIVQEDASRIGSLTLFLSAIISLITAVLLPLIIGTVKTPWLRKHETAFSLCLKRILAPWMTIRSIWIASHFLFAFCMFSTMVISSVVGTTILFAVVGISWAITNWVPYTILGIETSKKLIYDLAFSDPLQARRKQQRIRAGTILGLHSMAICLPQIIATLLNAIFWKVQENSMHSNPRRTVWILRAGGGAALVAMFMATYVQEPLRDQVNRVEYMALQERDVTDVPTLIYSDPGTSEMIGISIDVIRAGDTTTLNAAQNERTGPKVGRRDSMDEPTSETAQSSAVESSTRVA